MWPTKKHLNNSSAFKMSTNCLSVFDHFVGLAFKVLIIFLTNFVIYTNDMVFYWNSPPVLRPFVFLLQFSHVLINFNGMSRCPKLYALSLLLCVVNTICFVFVFFFHFQCFWILISSGVASLKYIIHLYFRLHSIKYCTFYISQDLRCF